MDADEPFSVDDFALLEKYALARHGTVVADHMMLWNVENAGGKSSDMAMRVGALVMADPVRKRRQWVVLANDEHSGSFI